MVAENHYQMRFAGESVSLEQVSAGDLAEMIASFEDLILSTIASEHPQLPKDDLALSLVAVKPGSINLEFCVHKPELIAPIIHSVSSAICKSDFSPFSPRGIEAIKRIASFTKKHNCQAEIIEGVDGLPPLATITPETHITSIATIRGNTSVYGLIFSIGGMDPNVHIELADGSRLICKISRIQAKALAEKLYSWVGFRGLAKWDTRQYQIQEFIVQDIIDYEPGSTLKTLNELSGVMKKDYQGISDVQRYIHELRYGETEVG